MTLQHEIILCTCPDFAAAKKIADLLIEKRLAACVNILPGITSVYRWQNKIETAQEVLLLIKSRPDQYSNIESVIKQAHPYELPEIISVSVENGLPGYLKWIDSCLSIN